MRKLILLAFAALLAAACVKERMVTTPCSFDIKINWTKGTRVQFTVTPADQDATYAYGVLVDEEGIYDDMTDAELMEWQLEWMRTVHERMSKEQEDVNTPANTFCYKGPRTIKDVRLASGKKWILYVFQVNPETFQAIGPLYREHFSTREVKDEDLNFTILTGPNSFTIQPEDPERTWFWEYEREDRIEDVYGTPFAFFYNVIDMYDEYDFLENLLCTGPFTYMPEMDRSLREGVKYTIAMAGCEGGEITSDVLYADFIYTNGAIRFTYSDVQIIFAGN